MKKKNVVLATLTALMLGCAVVAVAGCGGQTAPEAQTNAQQEAYELYVAYADSINLKPLSYEEWLASIKGEKGEKGEAGQDGAKGEDGKDGKGISSVFINNKGELIVFLTDGTTLNLGEVVGANGQNGAKGEDGKNGLTPFIGTNGNWWVGENDLGVKAQGANGQDGAKGEDGKNGLTPFIGTNGNWWIGENDLGVKAQGANGQDGVGIADVSFNEDGELVVTLTNGTKHNLGVISAGTAPSHGHEIVEKTVNAVSAPCSSFDIQYTVCETCHEVLKTTYLPKTPIHLFNDNVCTSCGSTNELFIQYGISLKANLEKKGYVVTHLTGTGDVVIPDDYEGTPITTIAKGVGYCDATSLTIGNNVTCIERDVFTFRSSLQSVTIGSGLVEIDENTFTGCSNLKEFIVSEKNSNYSAIFGNLYSKDNKTLVRYAIGKEDTSFAIPSGVTSIGDRAFFFCNNLTNITIPDSVTAIGIETFSCCANLTSLPIPNSVTSIGDGAFASCSSLTSITLPDSVTSIGDSAFFSCSTLTNITIPDGVTSIGDSAFCSCSALTSITIPNSVTSIGDSAFYGCSSLTSITIPNSVTGIGDSAFYGCYSLTKVVIGDGVTTLGDIFNFNNNIQSLSIGSGLVDINETFIREAIPFLKEFIVSVNNPNYSSIGGNLYSKDGKTLLRYARSKEDTSFTIPSGVTSIGNGAFYSCSTLTSITIPDSVMSIGENAFYDCTNLTSVAIGNSVTSIEISVFFGCSSLTSITIPDSVTSIGDYAFYGCYSLTSVIFENPNGWHVAPMFTNETQQYELLSTDLSDPSTAATYLTSTYYQYYWFRTES